VSSSNQLLSWERLSEWGVGQQALKAALAAGLAWALGGLVPGAPPSPYLAPLTAALTVQLTIAESITGAIHRTLGATIGVIVALLAGTVIGVSPLTVAALVVVAQVIAARLKLNVVGTSQVIVTALLVLTIGGATSLAYGWARVAETLLGAVIGVGVNALLAPPSYLASAEAAIARVVSTLQAQLEALAASLEDGLTPEIAAARLEQARHLAAEFEQAVLALDRAEQSLRYNLMAVRERERLAAHRSIAHAVEHTAIQVRTLSRTLFDAAASSDSAWLAPSALGCALATLIRSATGVLTAFVSGANPGESRTAFAHARAGVSEQMQANVALLVPYGWQHVGGAVAVLERLVEDLTPSDT
jgi:uncharacterized membrane protein YgaE (UPF0421/DUF939 family)